MLQNVFSMYARRTNEQCLKESHLMCHFGLVYKIVNSDLFQYDKFMHVKCIKFYHVKSVVNSDW